MRSRRSSGPSSQTPLPRKRRQWNRKETCSKAAETASRAKPSRVVAGDVTSRTRKRQSWASIRASKSSGSKKPHSIWREATRAQSSSRDSARTNAICLSWDRGFSCKREKISSPRGLPSGSQTPTLLPASFCGRRAASKKAAGRNSRQKTYPRLWRSSLKGHPKRYGKKTAMLHGACLLPAFLPKQPVPNQPPAPERNRCERNKMRGFLPSRYGQRQSHGRLPLSGFLWRGKSPTAAAERSTAAAEPGKLHPLPRQTRGQATES